MRRRMGCRMKDAGKGGWKRGEKGNWETSLVRLHLGFHRNGMYKSEDGACTFLFVQYQSIETQKFIDITRRQRILQISREKIIRRFDLRMVQILGKEVGSVGYGLMGGSSLPFIFHLSCLSLVSRPNAPIFHFS